jgi:hypothetical protein
MRESVGKSISREFFFAECLLDWLPAERIKKGNFLLLLNETPRELAYTDALEVPRSQVFSVEREERTYRHQLGQQLGAHLHFGDLVGYLATLLDGDQEFLVMNLDVEGSYLSQLDPAITPVLLMCWRNPETVVATYSSVGRDTEMLWEGVKSLAICLWLAPDLASRTLASLTRRYDAAGFTQPQSMALRDFFWIRSMLEHTLVSSAIMGTASQKAAQDWFAHADLLWRSVTRWRRRPLRLKALRDMVELAVSQDPGKREIIMAPPACLGSAIADFRHLVYNAQEPWSQLCYFSRIKVLEKPVDCKTWLEQVLGDFLKEPLIYVNRKGERLDIRFKRGEPFSVVDPVIWEDLDLYEKFSPRRLGLLQASPRLIQVWRAAVQARKEAEMSSQSKGLVDGKGRLSDEGKQLVQMTARKHRKDSAEDVVKRLPPEFGKVAKGVIRAHVAVGRRK